VDEIWSGVTFLLNIYEPLYMLKEEQYGSHIICRGPTTNNNTQDCGCSHKMKKRNYGNDKSTPCRGTVVDQLRLGQPQHQLRAAMLDVTAFGSIRHTLR
jgi:hypothetical protein